MHAVGIPSCFGALSWSLVLLSDPNVEEPSTLCRYSNVVCEKDNLEASCWGFKQEAQKTPSCVITFTPREPYLHEAHPIDAIFFLHETLHAGKQNNIIQQSCNTFEEHRYHYFFGAQLQLRALLRYSFTVLLSEGFGLVPFVHAQCERTWIWKNGKDGTAEAL